MIDPERMVGNLIKRQLAKGKLGKKFGKKVGKGLTSTGGLLLVGGLAYAAYEHFRHKPAQQTVGGHGGFGSLPPTPMPPPPPPSATQSMPLPPIPVAAPEVEARPADEAKVQLLVGAMLAAASADGANDAEERKRMLDHARTAGGAEAVDFLMAQLDHVPSVDEIARATGEDAALAPEVYTAYLLAIELDTEAEHAHLAELADALDLRPSIVRGVHEEVNQVSEG
ncbi:MAG: DUF533 domain-containing protein [Geminicoccaceae bacterium]